VFKAAVIGCGMIAGAYEDLDSPVIYSHGKAYFKNGFIEDIAFMDKHPERSGLLAQKYRGVAYNGIHELLHDFKPDCISVCVPDDHHFTVLKSVIDNSKSIKIIFAEKPVCSTREELKVLKNLERSTGIRIIVNHSRRFDSAHQRIKSLIQGGTLGKFIRGDVDYYGGWSHLGVHIVDILQYFFDDVILLKKMEYVCESKYPKDPTLNVDSALASVPLRMTGIDEKFYQILDINLKFEKGQIRIEDFGKDIRIFRKVINQEKENVLSLDSGHSGVGMTSPIVNAVETIVKFLKNQDEGILYSFGLEQAEITMNTLWKGVTLYENQS